MRREKVIRYNFSQIPTFLRASISSVYAISIEAVEIAKITLVGSKQGGHLRILSMRVWQGGIARRCRLSVFNIFFKADTAILAACSLILTLSKRFSCSHCFQFGSDTRGFRAGLAKLSCADDVPMFSESFWKQPRTFRGGGVRSASLLILDGAIMIRGGRWSGGRVCGKLK
jgi:hypothetical protein